MKTKTITINFGLVASHRYSAEYRGRVLAPLNGLPTGDVLYTVVARVIEQLRSIGCFVEDYVTVLSRVEPRLVIKCEYPWQAEIDDCAAPSVLKYEPYMRLYELATYFAQDCVAVVPDGEQGLLVGAYTTKWGAFDSTKFITLD